MIELGKHFYSAFHLLLYTGFYRLLPTRDFRDELVVGYALELFLSMIPMLFCIIFNNSEAISRHGSIQETKIAKEIAESSDATAKVPATTPATPAPADG